MKEEFYGWHSFMVLFHGRSKQCQIEDLEQRNRGTREMMLRRLHWSKIKTNVLGLVGRGGGGGGGRGGGGG